jgi:hypothetical protein
VKHTSQDDLPLTDLLADQSSSPTDDAPSFSPAGPDDPDEEFGEPAPPRRLPLATAVLTVALGLALAFVGGVLVQKHHDASLVASAGPAAGGPRLGGGGGPGGGGGGPAGGGAAPGTSGGAAAPSSDSGPVVIGTVVAVKGTSITVRDIGGKTHVVRTTSETTLTRTAAIKADALTAGTNVTVDGTKAADGSITATAVSAR